jgi:sulfotransferase
VEIMTHTTHFISGLPRSGSTLLCGLLRQNPRFSASVTSPVAMLCGTLQQKMAATGEFAAFFDDALRERMLRGVFDSYYATIPQKQVVFDTNRIWTGRAALIGELFPESKIICCVRSIGWIIDSIERMLTKNPLQLSRMFGFQPGNSIYSRVEHLMKADDGLIGQAWSMLRECWHSENSSRMVVVQYDNLVSDPKRVVGELYNQLGEPPFEHDFEHVVYDAPEFDLLLGMPGLHAVRSKVESQQRQPVIPPELFSKYTEAGFWLKPDANPRGVRVL